MKISRIKSTIIILVFLFSISTLNAAGTYSTGWILIKKLVKFEETGVFIDSYEVESLVYSFDKKEKCKEKRLINATPQKDKVLRFSIRKENSKVVNFLRKKKDKGGFVIRFRHHRFEPFAISTNIEAIDAKDRVESVPAGLPSKKLAKKTGSSRNFSLNGEI